VSTIASIFARRVAADPASPLVTWYDGATGERTELSGATLGNWVAKTANLLVDGCGLGAGDVAVVDLPPHWQTAAILLGCWTAGLTIAAQGGDVSFGPAGSTADFLVGLHPFALPLRDVPDGAQDWVLAARAHGDHYAGPLGGPEVEAAPALAGARVLINVDSHADPLDWLAIPLASGCSLVLCRNADAETRKRWAATERATIELD
jgi:uncharacterized protein (TIGR03089 family)